MRRKRIRRLMRTMALGPKPRTSSLSQITRRTLAAGLWRWIGGPRNNRAVFAGAAAVSFDRGESRQICASSKTALRTH
jgi:hypothetical protein